MVYLGKQSPEDAWKGNRSRGLAEGLMIYEQTQNRFGIPERVAQNPENAGFFEVVDDVIDHAEAAFQEWEKQSEKTEPGVQPVVRFDARAKASAEARRARLRAQQAEVSNT